MATLASIDLLRHMPLFTGLAERHLHAIVDSCQPRSLTAGTALVKAGSRAAALHLLIDGQVRVIDERNASAPLVIDVLGKGAHVGESLIDGVPAAFSVYCATEVEALQLAGDRLRDLLAAWPEIDAALHDYVSRREHLLAGGDADAGPASVEAIAPAGGQAQPAGQTRPAGQDQVVSRTHAARAAAGTADAAAEVAGGDAATRRADETPAPAFAGPIEWRHPYTAPPPRWFERLGIDPQRLDRLRAAWPWVDRLLYGRLQAVRQSRPTDAGPACLDTVCRHYGRRFSLNSLRDAADSVGRSARLPGLARAAGRMGFETFAGQATPDHLSQQHLPAIVGFDRGHWVTVVRLGADTVTVSDPAEGLRQLPTPDFVADWSGAVLYLRPTARFLELPERRPVLATLVPYLRPLRRIVGEVVLASVLIQVLALLLPVFAKFIVDDVIARRDREWLVPAVTAMMAVLALTWLTRFSRRYLMLFVSRQVDAGLTGDVFRHLLSLPVRFFERRHVGDIVSQFGETDRIRAFLTGPGVSFTIDMVTAALYLVLMGWYSLPLTGVALLFMMLEAGHLFVVTPLLGQGLRELFQRERDSDGLIIETLSNLKTIKLLAIEHFTRWDLEKKLTRLVNAAFGTLRHATVSAVASLTIGDLGLISVLFTGAAMVLRGSLSIGELVAFGILTRGLSAPFAGLMSVWNELQETLNSVEQVTDILETPPESADRPSEGQVVLHRLQGHIRFDHVRFRYDDDGADVLREINFECYGGQRVAIVGRSGSGKSTLIKLLLGFHRPSSGAIYVDGFDVTDIWLPSFRRQMGVVLQEPCLFRGAIRAAISQTMPAAPLTDIVSAARMVNAHGFISRLPLGYETRLEENSSNLSGGQRQQISIARALLHNPRMLVLDEATSNLDNESERFFQQNLDAQFKECTVFTITQRMDAVRHADLVLVLDRGAVVEQGPPDRLMAERGLFYRLSLQQNP